MNIIQSLVVSAALTAASLTSVAAFAQAGMDNSKKSDIKIDMSKDMTDGEVRKIDKETGKLTIKHGDIKNLDMPGMTMVFAVKDKAMLDKVKTGDKIKFKVVLKDGKMLVTDIQAAK